MEKLLLKVGEAAEMASVGRSKAYELVATGEWPSVSIGRSVRVPADGLRQWVEERKRVAEEARGFMGRGHARASAGRAPQAMTTDASPRSLRR